jgi:hypothetical protein
MPLPIDFIKFHILQGVQGHFIVTLFCAYNTL